MSGEEVHIVVHGGRRAEARSAANATIQALEAAGALVAPSSGLPLPDLPGDAIRGIVEVQEDTVAVAAPILALIAAPQAWACPETRTARAIVGAIVLLGLMSVQLRLRFGLGALLTIGLGTMAIL